ncbi:MAG: hypothetical protein ACYC25_13010 [Paludibacter sp.]
MRQKSKNFIYRTLVLFILFLGIVSCSSTNPPVDTTTGATTSATKK